MKQDNKCTTQLHANPNQYLQALKARLPPYQHVHACVRCSLVPRLVRLPPDEPGNEASVRCRVKSFRLSVSCQSVSLKKILKSTCTSRDQLRKLQTLWPMQAINEHRYQSTTYCESHVLNPQLLRSTAIELSKEAHDPSFLSCPRGSVDQQVREVSTAHLPYNTPRNSQLCVACRSVCDQD